MSAIKSFFLFELKRFFCVRNIIIFILFLLIALFIIQKGVSDYKNTLNQKEVFQDIELNKVSMYINYTQYGTYGIRMLFVPSPMSVFFTDSCIIPDMTSYVDSGERLKIYQPLKGKNLFDLKKTGFTDFSGIILFFGTLLALLYGNSSFKQDDYIKFLSTLSSPGQVFFSILVSRIAIIFLLILVLVGSALILIMVNGMSLSFNFYLVSFILLIFLVSLFFYILGTSIRLFRCRTGGIVAPLSLWFALLFLVPILINFYVAKKSNNITPLYKLEMDKFKIFSDFEKSAIEKGVTYRYGEKLTERVKETVLSYWNNEFKKIEALEEKMHDEMKSNISLYQYLSKFFPTTFYQSMTNEISSRGYDNLVEFYKKVQVLKREFVKNHIDKIYFSNFSKVESFVKGDENVFYGRSRMPENFKWGYLLNLFYIGLLTWFSYGRYKKFLYKEPKKEFPKPNQKPIHLNKRKYKVVRIQGEDIKNRVYNLLSGKRSKKSVKGFVGKLFIDNTDIAAGTGKIEFLYLCLPEAIPGDIKVEDFLCFLFRMTQCPKEKKKQLLKNPQISPHLKKTFDQLEHHEKILVLDSIFDMKTFDLYVVNDLCKGAPLEIFTAFDARMKELASDGFKVLYLTTQPVPEPSFGIGQGCSDETVLWTEMMKQYGKDKK